MKPEPHLFNGEYEHHQIMMLEVKTRSPVKQAQFKLARSRQWLINLAAALLFR